MGNYDFTLDLDNINTLSIMAKWIDGGKKILEFGPANGRFTKYLKNNKKSRVTIVEIDSEAGLEAKAFAAKSFLGAIKGDIEKYHWYDEKDKYDYIIFADVLEHLKNPKEVLQKCKTMLKDNGEILISIPNISHNSIIIDLMNDNFNYDKTGLLDITHIHFFTLSTFKKMIKECEMSIAEIVPIYSRVGNNEINNTYEDIPPRVEDFIRKRKEGSIYQYVAKISKVEKTKKTKIKYSSIDKYKTLEWQCYFKKSNEEIYNDLKKQNGFYDANPLKENIINIDINNYKDLDNIRFNPFVENGIVFIKNAYIENSKEQYQLEYIGTNALFHWGSLYYFDTEFPEIQFKRDLNGKGNKLVLETINYIVKLSGEETQFFSLILDSINKYNSKIITNKNKELKKAGNFYSRQEKEFKKSINNYIISLNSASKFQQQQENSINEQKEYIKRLENDINEQKEYIKHLENDIKELKEYINSIENKEEDDKETI